MSVIKRNIDHIELYTLLSELMGFFIITFFYKDKFVNCGMYVEYGREKLCSLVNPPALYHVFLYYGLAFIICGYSIRFVDKTIKINNRYYFKNIVSTIYIFIVAAMILTMFYNLIY